jgi:excisionase family DNA binding protein
MAKLLKPGNVADRLEVSEITVRKWLRDGNLNGFKIGKLWRIPTGEVDRFLRNNFNPGGRIMNLADQIRDYVFRAYVHPTRQGGQSSVVVRVGKIHDDMGLNNRVPAVCGALDARKFMDDYGVKILERSGPKHGRTVEFKIQV